MSSQELHEMLDKVLNFIIKDNSVTVLSAFSNCCYLYKELNKQKQRMDINIYPNYYSNERDKLQLQKIELDFKIAIHDLNNFMK